ncbi:uncharacterized protein si:ch211-269k10.4 isoform X2 [Anguilla anguilla]|uniref:uncharacterized protein si:ch211-269k10.4 isoform X2 n=1 Tax=Anguilla anguilla TaxID=7936 RepID=UPI0015AFFDF4|nr:uncharacterized protein si:ch211-269k10.4 isoform X2 [Anguilla anguilla]
MASAIFSMSDITEQEEEETGTRQPLIRQYCATEQIPGKELPLQDLLRKQPMALGYIICGLLSALLNRFTRLLPICFVVNIGCLSVAGVGIVLLAIDLSLLTDSERAVRPTKVLILCVIALMACISALLVFWLHREMRSMRKKF